MDTRTRRDLAYALVLLAILASGFTWQRHASPATAGSNAVLEALAPGERLRGTATVFDADTIGMQGRRLRLEGIDAPEFAQTCGAAGREWACGRAAIDALKGKIDGQIVECRIEGIDRYQRGLVRCAIGGDDLNRWLVRNGWAVRFGDDYLMDEIAAERERLGLWRDDFVRPSRWRKSHHRPE